MSASGVWVRRGSTVLVYGLGGEHEAVEGEVGRTGNGGRGGRRPGIRASGLTSDEAKRIRDVRVGLFVLPPHPTPSKPKIVGILILPSGAEVPLISGRHGGPGGGTQHGGIPRGPGSGFTAHTKTHVEGHAAAIMHQRGLKNATLLIEKTPCKACDNPQQRPNVSAMLPKGARLTVVDPHSASLYASSAR